MMTVSALALLITLVAEFTYDTHIQAAQAANESNPRQNPNRLKPGLRTNSPKPARFSVRRVLFRRSKPPDKRPLSVRPAMSIRSAQSSII